MTNEIRRNTWTNFCKQFSADNQYRPTQLTAMIRDGQPASQPLMPFLGVAIGKAGRAIEGIQFYAGRAESEAVAEPVLTVKEPTKIYIEKDMNGVDARLRIRSKDGSETTLELFGEPESSRAQELIEKVAYALYERRGYVSGNETDDWFEAERKVREAETLLTR